MRHPHYDVIIAFAEGKTIEYFGTLDGNWYYDESPSFFRNIQYRVKPEEKSEKREWVGLTSNEITECWILKHDHGVGATYTFAQAIEAKLKEKNT